MGLSSYFSAGARRARALRKAIRKGVDKHALSSERLRALETLRDDGSDSAVLGLLRRFSLKYEKSIEDEQEKEWVYEALCGLGPERVLPPLRRYLCESETVAWALRVLERIADEPERRDVLQELCEDNEAGYARDPSKKVQLLHFMGEQRDPALVRLLAPYLGDMNEEVRYTAAEGLIAHGGQGGSEALRALLPVLLDEMEESRRIKTRIAEGLNQFGLPVAVAHRAAAQAALDDVLPGARLDGQGRIRMG